MIIAGSTARLSYGWRAGLSMLTAVVVLTVFQLVVFGGLRVGDWVTSFVAILLGGGTTSFLLRHRAL